MTVSSHLALLETWFLDCPGALTAFSGGVDSSLVAVLAHRALGSERAIAVISASPSLKLSDLQEARDFARQHSLTLRTIVTAELQNANYVLNPANRCFYCKQTLYTELEELARSRPGWWILNGTNTDDLGDYRPGLEAAKDRNVRSPLAECGLSKQDVRALAAHLGLECWNKPAAPCLASRIPYGQRVTVKKMRQIEDGEALLHEAGFPVCRLRHFGDKALLEVAAEQVDALRAALPGGLKERLLALGFAAVDVDGEGFVSGKLNRSLVL